MPKKILLADDSITIQKVVGITLANEDYELVVVGNGADAVTKAKEVKPDLILADVVMPEKDGYQVCQEIKSDPEFNGTPVILLAGTFESFDEAKSKEVGADDHISKPFESQTLIEKVKAQLEKGGAASAAPAATEATPAAPTAPETPAVSAAPQPEPVPTLEPVAAAVEEEGIVDLGEDEMWGEADVVAEPVPAPALEETPPVAEEVSAADEEEDMWGGDEFDELNEVASVAAGEVEPEPAEEVVAEEDIWGGMDAEEIEEPVTASVEEVPTVPEDDFDFSDDVVDEPAPVAEVAPEPALAEPAAEPVVEAIPEPSVETPAPQPIAETVAAVAGEATSGISDEAVAKVAREIIEKIAWEVVPELAETLIKEEIKKLKGE